MNIDDTFDYREFITLIRNFVKEKTDIDLVPSNDAGPQEDYPFFSWDINSAHKDIGITDNIDHEVFEMSIEFTAHSQSSLDALKVANQLNKWMQTHEFNMLGETNNFYVIDESDVETSDNVISIQVERRASFTVNFRVQDQFMDDLPQMADLSINGASLSDKDKYKEGK